ncbi:hypothetical protein AOQ84DRAFT_351223 [Glonium stellatum]|uniref:F-box domain-containing protein n=1 Tax=Glonium stellatum TaxID=574774 RepID=A0A8E2JZP9_9PEZI|nr:hypothetical protein AOQ84DRAFT_351223 [Glonium stellatum]
MVLPPLFRLPVELRYQIYAHLSAAQPICYPFRESPITSISHRPPPLALLLTCHKLSCEALDYFHSIATFRFLALGVSQNSGTALHPTALSSLRKARRVEFMLMWNLTADRIKVHPSTWPWWMMGWLDTQVNLLEEEGHELRVVVVSLRDASIEGGWELKRALLEPLDRLKGRVNFRIGEIVTVITEQDEVVEGIKAFVKELNE